MFLIDALMAILNAICSFFYYLLIIILIVPIICYLALFPLFETEEAELDVNQSYHRVETSDTRLGEPKASMTYDVTVLEVTNSYCIIEIDIKEMEVANPDKETIDMYLVTSYERQYTSLIVNGEEYTEREEFQRTNFISKGWYYGMKIPLNMGSNIIKVEMYAYQPEPDMEGYVRFTFGERIYTEDPNDFAVALVVKPLFLRKGEVYHPYG